MLTHSILKKKVAQAREKLNIVCHKLTKKSIISIGKKGIALTLAIVSVSSLLVSSIAYGLSTSNYNMIGSNKALGSPLLNDNFVSEDWNKWETVAFGIFLSNFPVPLVDTYESALSVGLGGSDGSALKALQFGSGSDASNNETISGLLNYVIDSQRNIAKKPIYAQQTSLVDGIAKITPLSTNNNTGAQPDSPSSSSDDSTSSDPDDYTAEEPDDVAEDESGASDGLEVARFNDLFIQPSADSSSTTISEAPKSDVKLSEKSINGGYRKFMVGNGEVCAFYVENNSGGHELIYDMTNSWDIQMLNAWVSRTMLSDYNEAFEANLIKAREENPALVMDCFGNILCNIDGKDYMLIPAASNSHLTVTPKQNLVTSLVFNGSSSAINRDDIIQYGYSGLAGATNNLNGHPRLHGTGSVSGSKNGNLNIGDVIVTFDTDTILAEGMESGVIPKTGNMILDLFKLDMGNKSNKYGYNVQLVGMGLEGSNDAMFGSGGAKTNMWGFMKYTFSEKVVDQMRYFTSACNSLSYTAKFNVAAPSLTYILDKNGNQMSIFGEKVAVSSMLDPTVINGSLWQGFGANDAKISTALAANYYTPYIYDVIMGKSKAYSDASNTSEITAETVTNQLKTLEKPKDVTDWAYFDLNNKIARGIGKINPLYASFILDNKKLYNEKKFAPNELHKITHIEADPYTSQISMAARFDRADLMGRISSLTVEDQFERVALIHTQSNVMRTVSNILGIRDGTEFATYTPLIYMTYLDWYGITKGSKTGEQHEFNTGIFDSTSSLLTLDIESIGGITTVEDKKTEILNYSYLMLHPTKGREYRNDLIMSGISDWIYRQYQSTVYGNTSDYYSGANAKLETTSANSFLNINTYADNPWTGWFLKIYPQIMVWMLGIFMIVIIVFGLLKGRQLSWFFLSAVLIINAMLIVPSTGELIPYITNNMTQSMFSDNMTYWSISESISNAQLEQNVIKQTNNQTGKTSSLTEAEQQTVASMVQQLNIIYLDRSLMLKQDISKKITESSLAGYDKVQKLQSARWMLPIIMRQFTASDKSANYVYTPLGDAYDNMSNLYWYYNPADSMSTLTVNSATNTTPPSGGASGGSAATNTNQIPNLPSASAKQSIYPDYVDTSFTYKDKTVAETVLTEKGLTDRAEGGYDIDYFAAPGWQSESRVKSEGSLPHTYFYLLPSLNTPIPTLGDYTDGSWDRYVKDATDGISSGTGLKDAFMQTALSIEATADTYDMNKEETVTHEFGYLWSTESVMPYMYQVVKDTFPADKYIGSLVADLQGQYYMSTPLGEETRRNFMRYEDTGKIKDFLDLEEVFTNMVPYMYKMQILAGGMNGNTGLLGDAKIDEIEIYTGNNKSWLFRSNWATKLMESTTLTEADKVTDKDGNVYKIVNPMLPSCYPTERPMVFSEAEMFSRGLDDTDLSLPELKIIAATRAVEKKWTYLLNVVNTPGITKEVIYRQMALEATLAFNTEFSTATGLSGAHAMYPTNVDLRNMSFDSVMKMMMLNSTKDASYIYGDTMRRVIENSDMFTSLMMLFAAILSSKFIPGLRDVAMALIFFLGFWSVLHSLLSDGKQKAKVSFGYLVSNLLLLAMTLAYYMGFNLLIGNSEGSEILNSGATVIAIGDPLMICLVIIVISIAYLAGIWWMVCFCFKNWRDMGADIIASTVQATGAAISGGFATITNMFSADNNPSTSNTQSLKGSGRKNDASIDVSISGGKSDVKVSQTKEAKQTALTSKVRMSGGDTSQSSGDYVKIDREIHKGKEADTEKK